MTPRSDELLMRHLDGETDAAEARAAEEWLAGSAEARARMAELAALGDVVREAHAGRAAGYPDLTDSILARVAAEPAAGAPRSGGVVPLRRLRLAAPGIGLALAAAAAIALVVSGRAPAPAPLPGEPLVPPRIEPALAVEAPAAEPGTGASIESVDFGAQGGSIFMVASGPEVTPVVWLADDAPSGGGRMEAL